MDDVITIDNQHSKTLVLGFHGCDEQTGRQLISGELNHLSPSKNPYDWIGDGVYFFENDPARAWHFATTAAAQPNKKFTRRPIKTPFVVGAIIDLGHCLDLSNQLGINELSDACAAFLISIGDKKIPQNHKASNDDDDIILRNFDRAIVNYLHELRRFIPSLMPYDTVRSPFSQGKPIAESSAFQRYSHIQIAVRNANCIVGYFLPKQPLKSPFQGCEPN